MRGYDHHISQGSLTVATMESNIWVTTQNEGIVLIHSIVQLDDEWEAFYKAIQDPRLLSRCGLPSSSVSESSTPSSTLFALLTIFHIQPYFSFSSLLFSSDSHLSFIFLLPVSILRIPSFTRLQKWSVEYKNLISCSLVNCFFLWLPLSCVRAKQLYIALCDRAANLGFFPMCTPCTLTYLSS